MNLHPRQGIDARHYVVDEVLRDGRKVRIRAIRPDDKERLLEHFGGLGTGSRYFRFFGLKRALTSSDLVRFAELDFDRQAGLAATIEHNGRERFIGVGHYICTDLSSHAEIALAVLDEYQGTGIGQRLIGHLARIAHANGIVQFEANVMGNNQRMLTLLRHSGCVIHHLNNAGVVHFTLHCPDHPDCQSSRLDPIHSDRQSGDPDGGSHG